MSFIAKLQQSPKANIKRRHVTHPYDGLPLFWETALKPKVLSEIRTKTM